MNRVLSFLVLVGGENPFRRREDDDDGDTEEDDAGTPSANKVVV
jgi:hypothetical protein